MSLLGILENIIADAITLLIAISLSWLWIFYTQRKALLNFFNSSETKRLVIYLSNIKVLPFGATGISGTKFSYRGDAVDYGEMQAANHIQGLFSFIIPKLTEFTKSIGGLLLADVKAQILISPQEKKHLETEASIVSLGSPAYNIASRYIEDLNLGSVKFRLGLKAMSELEKDQIPNSITDESSTDPVQYSTNSFTAIVVNAFENPPSGTATPVSTDPGQKSNLIEPLRKEESAILIDNLPPIIDTKFGFVERIKDPKMKRSFFYVAGLSEFSTKGAGNYLSSQWKYLYKKYGENKSFLVLLKFEFPDFTKWSIVSEIEIQNRLS